MNDASAPLIHQRLVELAPHGIVVASMEGEVLFANAKALSQFAGSLETSLVGSDFLAAFSSADASRLRTAAGELASRTSETINLGATIRTADGQAVPVEICACLIECDGREQLYLTLRDHSDGDHMEEQFLRAQRMQTLGSLAGGIAHDLNNVLTPVSMALGIVKERVTDDMAKLAVEVALKSVQRGSELVGQVLTFARGDDDAKDTVNIRDATRELEKILIETLPPRINLIVESKELIAQASSTRIHQILMNLCVNARDAMPNGGMLVVRGSEVTLDEAGVTRIAGGRAGTWVCIEVRDTGLGMTPEIQKHIWDPFFSTKAMGKGTGLGLRTVAQIVSELGGFASVESEVGKGSTFRIYLHPGRLTTESETVAKADIPSGRGQTLLVCDDDTAVREMLATTLECYGYKIELAADGMEALSVHSLCQSSIDCVLTDVVMPFVDGFQLSETIRRTTPAMPVVLMSGSDDPQVHATAAAKGLKLLRKPFSMETLLCEIAGTLRARS